MNEQDFDDIGKRLYDLEADPPKDGWDRIAPVIQVTSPGRGSWLRRNWWKPLILLVPATVYFAVDNNSEKQSIASINAMSETVAHASGENQDNIQNKPDNSATADTDIKEENQATTSQLAATTPKQTDGNETKTTTTGMQKKESVTGRNSNSVTKARQRNESPTGSVTMTSHNLHQDIKTNNDDFSTVRTYEESKVESSGNLKAKENEDSVVRQDVSVRAQQEAFASGLMEEKKEIRDTALLAVLTIDSAAFEPESEAEKKEEETSQGRWRVHATFSPQFVVQNIRPIQDDDLLITEVGKNTRPSFNGFGFSIGAGRKMTDRFYLDAQLSIALSRQSIRYASTTGSVDTLIAERQPDGSVIVKPIYNQTQRETRAQFSSAGIRVGGMYYFLQRGRKSFSIHAAAGINFLSLRSAKEKADGVWSSLPNTLENNINYSASIGASYHLSFAKKWELMVGPAITYYAQPISMEGIPYNFSQHMFHLNLTISRNLIR